MVLQSNNCNISIITCRDGEESYFSAIGILTLKRSDATVTFRQEGDTVRLRLLERELNMERGTSLKMRFVPRRATLATVFVGKNRGNFQIFTTDYSVTFAKAIEAELDYELRFSQGVQRFSLKICIQSILEDS